MAVPEPATKTATATETAIATATVRASDPGEDIVVVIVHMFNCASYI